MTTKRGNYILLSHILTNRGCGYLSEEDFRVNLIAHSSRHEDGQSQHIETTYLIALHVYEENTMFI
jgi:hypothetical protein